MLFHFSKFKNQPYYRELNDEEGKTIAELAAIYYGTPYEDYEDADDEEEPMIYEENVDPEEAKEEPQVAEEEKNKEPPELELKQLPEELRYEVQMSLRNYRLLLALNFQLKKKKAQ